MFGFKILGKMIELSWGTVISMKNYEGVFEGIFSSLAGFNFGAKKEFVLEFRCGKLPTQRRNDVSHERDSKVRI